MELVWSSTLRTALGCESEVVPVEGEVDQSEWILSA